MSILKRVKKLIKTDDAEIPAKGERKEGPEKEEKAELIPVLEAKGAAPRKTSGKLSWVLSSPHVSEKATQAASQNQYIFRVSRQANKFEIKRAVEERYAVHVERVNVITIPPKKRRIRGREGIRPGYTKAVIRIKQGESITPVV